MLVSRLGRESVRQNIAEGNDIALLEIGDVLIGSFSERTKELLSTIFVCVECGGTEFFFALVPDPLSIEFAHGGPGCSLAAQVVIKFADGFCRPLCAQFSGRYTFESLSYFSCIGLICGLSRFVAPDPLVIFK